MRQESKFPNFDACIIAGDTFNSPRIYQGDVVRFFRILEALELKDKPIAWINGNHDPGSFHVVQGLNNENQDSRITDNFGGAQSLDSFPFMGIAGHSHSQNLDEVRQWLKQTDSQITVTHQSASMFMSLGNLDVDQLHPEDFHAPLNIIGDTHITDIWQENEVICLSPGILCPMRSRAEMESSLPRLVWLEAEYLGNGRFDLESGNIDGVYVRKRPHMFINTISSIDELVRKAKNRQSWEPPVLAFVDTSEHPAILEDPELHDPNIRVISYVKNVDLQNHEEDISIEFGGSVTVDTMVETAGKLIPEESSDRATTLSLVRDLLSSDSPAEIATNYLKG